MLNNVKTKIDIYSDFCVLLRKLQFIPLWTVHFSPSFFWVFEDCSQTEYYRFRWKDSNRHPRPAPSTYNIGIWTFWVWFKSPLLAQSSVHLDLENDLILSLQVNSELVFFTTYIFFAKSCKYKIKPNISKDRIRKKVPDQLLVCGIGDL